MRYSACKTLPLWVALLSGCASSSSAVPLDRVTAPEASLSAAEALGAENSSQAQLHLQLAREQLDKGKKLLAAGDSEEAQLLLMRADADAQLAQALAKENTAEAAAQQLRDQVTALQNKGR
ncbi:MAG: DUF4398 domain-containing protein [Byssovorax sp.]